MRKTFSITNKDVLKKLDTLDNQSKYIQELVLRDMYGEDNVDFQLNVKNKLNDILAQVEDVVRVMKTKG